MAEFGLGQEQAGDKGAERHGEAGEGRQQAGPQDHQEAGGHEQLLAPRLGHRPHHGAQEEPAEPDQAGDHGDRRCEAEEQIGRQACAVLTAEEGKGDQYGRDGEILEQEHGEGDPPGLDVLAAILREDGHDDGGGRKRHGRADRGGSGRGGPEEIGRQANDQPAAEDLQGTQTEDIAPHEPEPGPGQFEPDHEHQEDHAQLAQLGKFPGRIDGELSNPGRMRAQGTQSGRSKQDARPEEAQHRTDPPATEQGNHDARRRQEQDNVLEISGSRVRHGFPRQTGLWPRTPGCATPSRLRPRSRRPGIALVPENGCRSLGSAALFAPRPIDDRSC